MSTASFQEQFRILKVESDTPPPKKKKINPTWLKSEENQFAIAATCCALLWGSSNGPLFLNVQTAMTMSSLQIGLRGLPIHSTLRTYSMPHSVLGAVELLSTTQMKIPSLVELTF